MLPPFLLPRTLLTAREAAWRRPPRPPAERRMAADAPPAAKDRSGLHTNTAGAAPAGHPAPPLPASVAKPACVPGCGWGGSRELPGATALAPRLPRCHLTASTPSPLHPLVPAPPCRLRLRPVQLRPVAVGGGVARSPGGGGVPRARRGAWLWCSGCDGSLPCGQQACLASGQQAARRLAGWLAGCAARNRLALNPAPPP